jgi:biopolymer transport protein ExbD
MATLDVGGASGRRALNHDIPLVPFIDFLLCIVAFLLVTAVWSRLAVVDASALVPRDAKDPPSAEEMPSVLHVDMRSSDEFLLSWRKGNTVVSEERVPRAEVRHAESQVRYPALADAVARAWNASGLHRGTADPVRDRAVVHSGNAAPFDDIVATMDAIRAVRRAPTGALRVRDPSAFDVVFAVD